MAYRLSSASFQKGFGGTYTKDAPRGWDSEKESQNLRSGATKRKREPDLWGLPGQNLESRSSHHLVSRGEKDSWFGEAAGRG